MGRNLRFWLATPDAAPFDPGDAPLALGALLLRAARTDYAGLFSAPATLDAILARRYDLTVTEAAEMREACERVEAAAPQDSLRFAAVLHMAVCYHERLAIALSLIEVTAALGICHPDDPLLAALLQAVLGVQPVDLQSPRRAG